MLRKDPRDHSKSQNMTKDLGSQGKAENMKEMAMISNVQLSTIKPTKCLKEPENSPHGKYVVENAPEEIHPSDLSDKNHKTTCKMSQEPKKNRKTDLKEIRNIGTILE